MTMRIHLNKILLTIRLPRSLVQLQPAIAHKLSVLPEEVLRLPQIAVDSRAVNQGTEGVRSGLQVLLKELVVVALGEVPSRCLEKNALLC